MDCTRLFRLRRGGGLLAMAALAAAGLAARPAAAQYCVAGSGHCSVSAADERISQVTLNTLDHQSDVNTIPAGCYSDFTAFSTTLERGSSHQISIAYVNSFNGDNGTAWVDWNHDFDFDDPGETFTLTRTPGLFTGLITVPIDAPLGATRLRVRVTYTGTSPACGNPSQNYGEVQDFTLIVAAAQTGACCSAGSPGCAVVATGACAGMYQGDGTTCAPSNPCGGACCTGGSCAVSLGSACPTGSVFVNHAVCTPDTCRYCDAGVQFCNTTANELITRVVFANLDNSSAPDDSQPCYSDFTAVSTQVSPGATYTFLFEYANPDASDQAAVWFDWNRNFVLGDGPGEVVVLSHPGGNPAAFGATVTVPAGAVLGPSRMRVRVMWTGTPLACGSNTYGEVEDYTLNVALATNGACCGAGTGVCTITSPGACSGAYQGNATTCTPANPCGGACCTGGACAVSVAAACPAGSIFLNGAVCTPAACRYCDAGVQLCNAADNELITRVAFAQIDQSSAPDNSAPCYSNFTSVTSTVERGATYALRVEYANPTSVDQAAAWFDWNRDFLFADAAAGERVDLAHLSGDPAVFEGSVTVPAGASLGDTRMRVRVLYTGTPLACGNNNYGEVEDYTLTITAGGGNGACCAGSTCSVSAQGACSGANTRFVGPNTACNAAGNNTQPCCRADYNQSGAVTVQDIFDFLAGYFTQSPQADINGAGGVTVQDIFDFLAAYFTGC